MNRLVLAVLVALGFTAVVAFIIELGPGVVAYSRENPDEALLFIVAGMLLGLGLGGKR